MSIIRKATPIEKSSQNGEVNAIRNGFAILLLFWFHSDALVGRLLDPIDQPLRQLVQIEREVDGPAAAYRAAKRALRDEMEKQPKRIETVATLQLGALVMRLSWLDTDVRELRVVWWEAGVDGLKTQGAHLIVLRNARFEGCDLSTRRFSDLIVLERLLQPPDDAALRLDGTEIPLHLNFQQAQIPFRSDVLQFHFKHLLLQLSLHCTHFMLTAHETALPFAGVHFVLFSFVEQVL